AARGGDAGKLIGFGKVSGGRVKYKTGSHIDVDGVGALVGLAAHGGDLTLGGFFEYGTGNTSTHNHFSSGRVKGKGDVEYRGLGLLAHYRFGDGYWLEGSLRGGRVETAYRSRDLVALGGVHARYEGDAHYASAHAGIGKTWNAGNGRLDAYAQWLWTREGGDTVRLSTGERLEFKAMQSKRLRLGGRYTHALTPAISGFAGLALEREFDGKAKAATHIGSVSYRIAVPEMKGNSGTVELGVSTSPTSRLSIEAGVQVYAGKRKGVTGGVQMSYRF
ncbi:MAG: autotransporter outer membrane beta-barrel domain-containing protein, partial [Candidatus Accumulibacter sp.]|nr:autotransporter outer membrane beta-barrel domain-containing protein [Accumulibacter sp.]